MGALEQSLTGNCKPACSAKPAQRRQLSAVRSIVSGPGHGRHSASASCGDPASQRA
jgi:hypothetical protein